MICLTIAFITIFVLSLANTLDILIEWSLHKHQVKTFTDVWDYGTYDKFVELFNKTDWDEMNYSFPNSYFTKTFVFPESKVHASIIKFVGKGMILGPIDYYRFSIFMNKKKRSAPSKQKPGLWK